MARQRNRCVIFAAAEPPAGNSAWQTPSRGNAGPSARVGCSCSVIIGPGRSCMEFPMRSQISYTVLAAALFGGASIANAQDVVTRPLPPGGVVMRPAQMVETVPVETVETVQ